jgi:hypothetical protein
MCAIFEPGLAGQETNDSLACRIHYTSRAATDPTTFCQQSGPLAVGNCVKDPCVPFCSLGFNLCNPLKVFPFADETACRTACSKWPYLKTTEAEAGAVVGDILFASGDTLNCRLYHLESAFEVGNPAAAPAHCPHIADESSTCN